MKCFFLTLSGQLKDWVKHLHNAKRKHMWYSYLSGALQDVKLATQEISLLESRIQGAITQKLAKQSFCTDFN